MTPNKVELNPDFKVKIDPELEVPLKIRVAQDRTNMKVWVSNLIRQALAEGETQNGQNTDKAA